MIEGSLEVKLPTIWTYGKAGVGRVRQEKSRREKIREEKRVGEKRMQVREKVAKVEKHYVFPMICGSGGSKSRLAKAVGAAGAEPCGQMRVDDKLHGAVAQSTFGSHHVQSTRCSDHFWKLRCRKSARRCGAKHIWKPKCTKHTSLGPLLEVDVEKSAGRCGAKHVSQSKV